MTFSAFELVKNFTNLNSITLTISINVETFNTSKIKKLVVSNNDQKVTICSLTHIRLIYGRHGQIYGGKAHGKQKKYFSFCHF